MTTILVTGLNHKTAPIEIRERLAFGEPQIPAALERLLNLPSVGEGLILSTCNRVEVWAVAREPREGLEQIKRFLLDHRPDLAEEQVLPCLYSHAHHLAIRHLLRVTSSLDSMIVGEPQILGQVKEAFEIALNTKSTGVILNKVFKKAISVAKRVRTETGIAENAVSISFAAVELAKKVFEPLTDKEVLVLGGGEMAELALRHLMGNGVGRIRISNRSHPQAVALAEEFGGQPIPFDQFPSELSQADIVLCSTGAPHYLVTPDQVREALRHRRNRPIFLIDISVPRNIDPEVNRLNNVFLYDIDDLQSVVNQNLQERRREAHKAEAIVAEEIEGLLRWLKSLEVVPTVVALRDRAETIRKDEVERLLNRLSVSGAPVSAELQDAVERMSSAIIAKLLHAPMTMLKMEAAENDGPLFIEAARRLFDLNGDIPSRRTQTPRTPKSPPDAETEPE
jgi:glutamyl-tRNA reductase